MDLERTTRLARAALENLERHRRRINALNVYPVPDGDTGTNLTLTVRGIVEALERHAATPPAERPAPQPTTTGPESGRTTTEAYAT